MKRWLKRIALGFVALLIVAAGGGAIYEAYARRQAVANFPPAGKMVSIGERSLQIDCRGSGSPTVVFESGLDIFGSLSWVDVHEPIAGLSRACAYSRAGLVWSDPAEDMGDGEAVAEDLHKLLIAAGEKPPFVIVAHSLGGPYAMIYTKLFGGEVAGLVFVDASHPDQIRRFQEAMGSQPGALQQYVLPAILGTVRRLMWTGLGRLLPTPTDGSARGDIVVAYGPLSLGAMIREQEAIPRTLSEAGTFRDLGTRPLFVLTAMKDRTEADLKAKQLPPEQIEQQLKQARGWQELQEDQAKWSSVSEHQLVPDAGHYIHVDKPDVVIAAVQWVLERVRDGEQGE